MLHIIIGFVLLVLAFGLFPRVALGLAAIAGVGAGLFMLLVLFGNHGHPM